MNNYTHLNEENRFEIYEYKQEGLSVRKIAEKMGKNPSTISRELSRNKSARGYRPKHASEKTLARKKSARKSTKMNPELIAKIEMMLSEDWSPEQISGALGIENINVSHECIYQYIWQDKKNGGKLYMHLRHGHKRRNRKRGKSEFKDSSSILKAVVKLLNPLKAVVHSITKAVIDKLNHRPRKTLDFLSPFQIFSPECRQLGIIW